MSARLHLNNIKEHTENLNPVGYQVTRTFKLLNSIMNKLFQTSQTFHFVLELIVHWEKAIFLMLKQLPTADSDEFYKEFENSV